MATLTNRGRNANTPARLPSLQAMRLSDPQAQKAFEVIREWLEVRLGARGDRFERAVTFRDLDSELASLQTQLDDLQAALVSSASTTSTSSSTSTSTTSAVDVSALQAAVASVQSALSQVQQTLQSQIALLTSQVAAAGDFSTDVASSVVGEVVLFNDTTGKLGTRATATGYAKLTSGVLSADSTATVRADLQGDGSAVDQVAYRGIPLTSRSADYTLALADAGKGTLHPGADANARTFTIPANASVAFPVGTTHTFVNRTSQVVTIAITTDTLLLAGTTTTGSRSLAQNGVATALKVESNVWVISGPGLT